MFKYTTEYYDKVALNRKERIVSIKGREKVKHKGIYKGKVAKTGLESLESQVHLPLLLAGYQRLTLQPNPTVRYPKGSSSTIHTYKDLTSPDKMINHRLQ